jgi:hypothetical protein
MTDKIIDFTAAHQRRLFADIDADAAHWEHVRDQLIAVMCASQLHDKSLISATLRALLDTLNKEDLDEAKRDITRSLAPFF